MSKRRDGQTFNYEPFGEVVEAISPRPAVGTDVFIRNAAIAVFWTLALLLTTGRAYFGGYIAGQSVAVVASAVDVQQATSAR